MHEEEQSLKQLKKDFFFSLPASIWLIIFLLLSVDCWINELLKIFLANNVEFEWILTSSIYYSLSSFEFKSEHFVSLFDLKLLFDNLYEEYTFFNNEEFHNIIRPLLEGTKQTQIYETMHVRKDGSKYDGQWLRD